MVALGGGGVCEIDEVQRRRRVPGHQHQTPGGVQCRVWGLGTRWSHWLGIGAIGLDQAPAFGVRVSGADGARAL